MEMRESERIFLFKRIGISFRNKQNGQSCHDCLANWIAPDQNNRRIRTLQSNRNRRLSARSGAHRYCRHHRLEFIGPTSRHDSACRCKQKSADYKANDPETSRRNKWPYCSAFKSIENSNMYVVGRIKWVKNFRYYT